MERSSTPGTTPSISSRLANWLQDSDEATLVYDDPVDVLIAEEGLQIARFVCLRELDMFLIVLSSRQIISRSLSGYSLLHQASDQQLSAYTLSAAGIHWPDIDVDLSLRGFLLEEAMQSLRNGFSSKKAA